jgi:alpha-tubulin suppressor-like RCC1 family protein
MFDKQNLRPTMLSDDGISFTKHTLQWPYNGPIRKIACGNDFCLALGDYICCGYGDNRFGQVGIGRYSPLEPTFQRCVLPKGVSVQDIATGSTHAAILSTSGQLFAFGNGAYYKLGLGDDEHRAVPTLVPTLQEVGAFRMDGSMSGVKLVACGAFHTIAVSDGTNDVYGWGWNKFGILGRNPAQHTGTGSKNKHSAEARTAFQRPTNVMKEHREEIVALPRRIEELDDADLLGDAAGQEAEALGRDVVKVTCGGRHTALLTQGGRVIVM